MASEIVFVLPDTVDWGRNWLVDFIAGKTQLVLFYWSKITGAIDVKMDGSDLKEKSSFKMLQLLFSSKLEWVSNIIYIAKTVSKEIWALIGFMRFLSPEVSLSSYKSTNHVWNTVIRSGLVLLVAN